MLNLLEYKKYCNIAEYIENSVYKFVTEWNYSEFKDSLIYKTFEDLDFLEKDYVDLQKIKDYDPEIYDIVLSNFLKALIWRTQSDGSLDNELSEDELVNMTHEEYEEWVSKKEEVNTDINNQDFAPTYRHLN